MRENYEHLIFWEKKLLVERDEHSFVQREVTGHYPTREILAIDVVSVSNCVMFSFHLNQSIDNFWPISQNTLQG